jgi:hypothetical protein
MAGEVPPLNVEILVQLSNLTAAVTQATEGMNKIGDAAKGQESKFSSLKSTMLGVFGGNLMTKATDALVEGLHDAMKAISDTQVATEQLSTAMNNAKQNTASNREEVTKTSEKMSGLGFSAASTENAYTKLISATGSVSESTKLMSMAADLARYKHEDLATAAATLQKGTMGSARAFKEFGITLDSHLPKNQAVAKAMDELNAKIGGQAVGYTKTFAGQMEVLKAKFDDVAVKVGAVVMPILTKLMEFISKILVPAIEFLYNATIGAWIKQLINLWNTHEGLRKVIVGVIEAVVGAFGYLLGAIAKVVDTIAKIPILGAPFKALGKGIDEAALSVGKFGKGLDDLANKKIKLPTMGDALATSGSTGTGGDTGIGGGLGAAGNVDKAATAAEKALAARNAKIKTLDDQAIAIEDKMHAALLDRQNKIEDAKNALADKSLTARTKYDDEKLAIETKYDDAISSAQDTYNTSIENAATAHEQNLISIQQQYADKATQLQQAAVDKRASIIQQSIGVMVSAFSSATKIDLGKLFTTGKDASGLASQLKDQLAQITKLQADAGALAAAGYNQAFINEVIAQGPAQGDALAQSVLNATPETQASIKDLYSKITDASENGVTALATKMNDGVSFANENLSKQFAQVNVDLKKQLSDNATSLTDALTKENDSFAKSMKSAQDALDKATKAAGEARDAALVKANEALSASLLTAQNAFDTSIKAISDSSMAKLAALQTQLDATSAKIVALGGKAITVGDSSLVVNPPSYSTYNPDAKVDGRAPVTYNVSTTFNTTGVNMSDPNAVATALRTGVPLTIPAATMKVS